MRTHYCGEVTESLIDEEVSVCGWVHGRRDHGGVIFIDLRDREGLLQVVFDPDTPAIFEVAEHVRSEYVLQVTGRVRFRPEGMENPALRSGRVEVLAKDLVVLSRAETPPFHHDEPASEELRLRFRYLDLRREPMQQKLRLRHRVTQALRSFLDTRGFIDIETPVLTKATPEGARDYLVPSRTQPGRFFALPQSPQIFKQLLMMSGFDRYYQIARCFRDEDLRADRQPEFTQLDVETTFMDEEGIMSLMEEMMRYTFKEVLGSDLPDPFPRMTYTEALEHYGTDRPDLRNPLVLTEVSNLVENVEFKVFAGPAKDPAGRVCAMNLPGGAKLTRKELDDLTPFVQRFGAKGLAYIKVNDRAGGREGLQSPILKFLDDEALESILARTGAQTGDVVFFGADHAAVVNQAMSALREKLAGDLGLSEQGWQPVWIVEFPMFEWEAREKRWSPLHHPFTSPTVEAPEALEADPASVKSRAYDMVLNGFELGGGSIRIHDQAMQSTVFRLLDISEEEARERFGFLLDALKYGCPPHGGIAFGLDRIAMLMAGADSIREVIAFPKTQTASCPLTSAPAEVPPAQLRELGIRLRKDRT